MFSSGGEVRFLQEQTDGRPALCCSEMQRGGDGRDTGQFVLYSVPSTTLVSVVGVLCYDAFSVQIPCYLHIEPIHVPKLDKENRRKTHKKTARGPSVELHKKLESIVHPGLKSYLEHVP